jgi:hypothetical protein
VFQADKKKAKRQLTKAKKPKVEIKQEEDQEPGPSH